MNKAELKKKIIGITNESSFEFWDKAEMKYTEMSDKDSKLMDELDGQMADNIIKLFEDGVQDT